MSDELEIRNTSARFCQYLDGRRFDEWSQLFTPDADFQGTIGREQILAEMLKGGLARRPELFRQHNTSNLIIELSGDEAHVESDLLIVEHEGDGPCLLRTGRYLDRMVRTGDGRWRFAQRLLDWTTNPIGQNG